MAFHYDKQIDPARDKEILTLTTDTNGEARLTLPEPAPKNIEVIIHLSHNKWDCVCNVFDSSQQVIRKGIVTAYKRHRQPLSIKAEPGEIVVAAHKLPLWEQPFRPLYGD